MPPRLAFGPLEWEAVREVADYYGKRGIDPGYQGVFEQRYCESFAHFMGGGYADAVATGTAALFVAIAALGLPVGSEVIVSPITDPGTISAIIFNRLVPRLADSAPESYNMGRDEFVSRISPNVRAALLVHAAGRPADITGILKEAHQRGIYVIEDCSQAHGARVGGQLVGSFGDIAAFSTMYRKAHISGASGGLIYTRDPDLYHRVLAHADRGKPCWRPDFEERDPNTFLFPALNWHTDEISCAVGRASFERLPATIKSRLAFVEEFSRRLHSQSRLCRSYGYSPDDSPFIHPVIVDVDHLNCSKREFAEALVAEGIAVNPHYKFVVSEWSWAKPYMADSFDTPNACSIRNRSFCLYLNENYTRQEAADAVAAIVKLENYFGVQRAES